MGKAFQSFFAFIQQLFAAAEKGASSLNNLAEWADESTKVFVDESRHARLQKIKAMEAEAALPVTAVPAIAE